MNECELAYLAGAIDSDGSIGIRKSSYKMRVAKDATQPCYWGRVFLKQVTPQIPAMLHEAFGGRLALEKPSSRDGRPLHSFQVTHSGAASICRILLPYLRVKCRQAETVLELESTRDSNFVRLSYWFEKENPNWREMEMLTSSQVMKALGYASIRQVSQAAMNKTLLALPWNHCGKEQPRFPKPLVELIASKRRASKRNPKPAQLIAWRESLYQRIRELNKSGVIGTPVYRREGCFANV